MELFWMLLVSLHTYFIHIVSTAHLPNSTHILQTDSAHVDGQPTSFTDTAEEENEMGNIPTTSRTIFALEDTELSPKATNLPPESFTPSTEPLSVTGRQHPTVAAPWPNSTDTVNRNSSSESSDRIPIYLGGYFSFGGGWEGSGMLPACQMALDHINQRHDILPGYELKMVWNDTQCEPGLATRVFFDQLYRQPIKTMILGAPCSPASQIMSGTAHYWNLIAISPSAASPGLSNREKYPFFYRTYMPDAAFNPARIRLMREFGWKRVATIHENHEVFSLAIDDLLTSLKEANITIVSSESFAEDPKNQIENLKSQDAKIIIGNMYARKARRVLCEAYKQGMTGPDYVWMLIGWYIDKWWLEEDDTITCSMRELQLAVEGVQYISTESLPLSTSDKPTVAGITPAEYQSLYLDRMNWTENRGYLWNSLGTFAYDAAWAAALAFDKAVHVLKTKRFLDGSVRRLEDFTYDDSEMRELFFSLLTETEFDGVSGPVAFSEGDRVGITQIEQIQGSCVDGWRKYRSTCFKLVAEPALNTAGASAFCARSIPGGLLAHFEAKHEHEFLVNISESESLPRKWLVTALPPIKNEGNGSWIPPGSSDDVIESGACVVLDFQNSGKLQTADCSEALPFVCRVRGEFKEKQVGLYSAWDDTLEWRDEIEWPGGGPPLDRTPIIVTETIRVYQGVTPVIYFTMCGVVAFCIAASIFFLVFNIKYRQQRHVKMSSPNLNNLIIIGAVLIYFFIVVGGLDNNLVSKEVFGVMCYVKTWTLSVGFVLAFGAMFSKTWRVHRVAAFKTPKRRIVTDRQLFIMVFVLLLIDVIILTLWQVIDPVKIQTDDLYPQPDPVIPNRVIQPYINYCTCDTQIYWLGALYSYKGLLLIFGTFLAWETRKVTISGLNDSKLIGISVYNVIILCLIGVAVSVAISGNPEVLFIFVACIILFCTSITLLVIFVPKIIAVVKYPDGDPAQFGTGLAKQIKTKAASSSNTNTSMASENETLRNKIQELEAQVQTLETRTNSRPIPVNGAGFGCWICGLVCGFSPSRGKKYSYDNGTGDFPSLDDSPPSGSSTAIANI